MEQKETANFVRELTQSDQMSNEVVLDMMASGGDPLCESMSEVVDYVMDVADCIYVVDRMVIRARAVMSEEAMRVFIHVARRNFSLAGYVLTEVETLAKLGEWDYVR